MNFFISATVLLSVSIVICTALPPGRDRGDRPPPPRRTKSGNDTFEIPPRGDRGRHGLKPRDDANSTEEDYTKVPHHKDYTKRPRPKEGYTEGPRHKKDRDDRPHDNGRRPFGQEPGRKRGDDADDDHTKGPSHKGGKDYTKGPRPKEDHTEGPRQKEKDRREKGGKPDARWGRKG